PSRPVRRSQWQAGLIHIYGVRQEMGKRGNEVMRFRHTDPAISSFPHFLANAVLAAAGPAAPGARPAHEVPARLQAELAAEDGLRRGVPAQEAPCGGDADHLR